jgi:hypothetical protein
MSTCSRCGANFGCALADGLDEPCWCTRLPPVVPLPPPPPYTAPAAADKPAVPGCWCPACLAEHIARTTMAAPATRA